MTSPPRRTVSLDDNRQNLVLAVQSTTVTVEENGTSLTLDDNRQNLVLH
jgi:hypothetical protein